eukprot:c23668_g1_i1 orf=302-880(-)
MDVLFTSLPLGLSCSPPLRPRHQPHSLICVPVGRDIRHWAVRVVTQSDWVKRTSYCRSRGRIVCTGDSTEDAARKALEQAFSEKKKDFRRWDEEIKNREATSGGGGSRGWSGGGGGGDGGDDSKGEDNSWDEAVQVFLATMSLIVFYLFLIKGRRCFPFIINVIFFVLCGFKRRRRTISEDEEDDPYYSDEW